MVVPSTLPHPDDRKGELRRLARTARAGLVPASWTPGSHAFEAGFDRGLVYASYRPFGSEADPAPVERIAAGGHNMLRAYPRVDADGRMRFYHPTLTPMIRDAAGMEVPASDAREALPSILFVPLLAFDRSGTRLGQGGGHYDRAIAALRAVAARAGWALTIIGLGWAEQEMGGLPRDPWDEPLDAVLTQKEWIECRP